MRNKSLGIINIFISLFATFFFISSLSAQTYTRQAGKKSYEIKSHLGDVTALVNDIKHFNASIGATTANVLSVSNFYSYGMEMPGRTISKVRYRYGYNGMEMDNELKGIANSLNFNARLYDPRVATWLSLDPFQMKYPGWSPYNFCFNNPIRYVDPNGKEPQFYEDGRFKGMNPADKSKTITVIKADGSKFNTNLTLAQLVDRAAWIIHEGGGVAVEYYANAIKNMRAYRNTENSIYSGMVSGPSDKGLSPDQLKQKHLYDISTNFGKKFAPIKASPEKISNGAVGQSAVKAIFDASMGSSADPTEGAYGWAGGDHVQFAYALNHAKSGTAISVVRDGKSGLLNIFYQEDFNNGTNRKITTDDAKEYLYMHFQLSSGQFQMKDAKNIDQWRAAKDLVDDAQNKIKDFEAAHDLTNNKVTAE